MNKCPSTALLVPHPTMGQRSKGAAIKSDAAAQVAFRSLYGEHATWSNVQLNHLSLRQALYSTGNLSEDNQFVSNIALIQERTSRYHHLLGMASVAVQDPTSSSYDPTKLTMAERGDLGGIHISNKGRYAHATSLGFVYSEAALLKANLKDTKEAAKQKFIKVVLHSICVCFSCKKAASDRYVTIFVLDL